jgi:hypothetical protein
MAGAKGSANRRFASARRFCERAFRTRSRQELLFSQLLVHLVDRLLQ